MIEICVNCAEQKEQMREKSRKSVVQKEEVKIVGQKKVKLKGKLKGKLKEKVKESVLENEYGKFFITYK